MANNPINKKTIDEYKTQHKRASLFDVANWMWKRDRVETIILAVDKAFKINLMKSPKIKKLYENL
jgi:hypothetical protein